jgi:hypothetical protein
MMQFDTFLLPIFLLMSLLENATSPWGQSQEWVLHTANIYPIKVMGKPRVTGGTP